MTKLTTGQAVKARTVRGTTTIAGKVTEIVTTAKGLWVMIQPNDTAAKPFKTRPALCAPA